MEQSFVCKFTYFNRFYFDKHDTIRYSINITRKEFVTLLKHCLVNRELAVIIRARAASRAGETAMTVTRVCSRIALVVAHFDRLYCFKSDAD